MSNLIPSTGAGSARAGSQAGSTFESFPARTAEVGALTVRRVLPVRQRRMVGPWRFFDRFGPVSFADGKPMDVAPHPHIGLQTVSWLIEGEVLHNDSIGGEGLLHPGELNLMTAGSGIAHAEETPPERSGRLDGIQLWVALPDAHRHSAPTFTHYRDIPIVDFPGGHAAVIMGDMANVRSPAKTFSPLIASELTVNSGELLIPLDPDFEHALVILSGDVQILGQTSSPDALHYLGVHRDELALSSRGRSRAMLVGGTPFPEAIVMWWNFVARSNREIEQAREDWEQRRRFGEVKAYRGPRLEAPALRQGNVRS